MVGSSRSVARLFTCVLAIVIVQVAGPVARADLSTGSSAPFYTAAGIVHAATQTSEALAPNTIATVYGTNLAYSTRAVAIGDLNDGALPVTLEGVTVYVHGISSSLFFVSPGQINFLVPYELVARTADVVVVRQGVAGPSVTIQLATTAPGLFQWHGNFALAEHANGSLVSADSPAQAGEVVVLFAAGLGRTVPDSSSGHVPQTAAPILYGPQLQVLLNGNPLPAASIFYAGVTPGFAGLYQINVKLPDVLPADPEIRVVIGAQASPASIQLTAH
jgi:uncharacterized protein (TIGR03437 family)